MHPTNQDPYAAPQPPPNAYDAPSLYVPPEPQRSMPHAMQSPVVVDNRARNAAIALIACGVLLLIGLVSRAWFSTRGGNVGLLGIEECRGSICRGMSWFDIKRAPSEIKMFSTIGIIGILAALGFLIQAAVVLFKRQPNRVMVKFLNGSLGLAAFGCFSFFFSLSFGEMSRKLSMSYAGLFAMAAIIGASIVFATMIRPLTKATTQ